MDMLEKGLSAEDGKRAAIETARKLVKQYKLMGYHCSESVIRACSEAVGVRLPEEVVRSACGFRGGGGGYGDRCGVVEAGCMIISYVYGRTDPQQEVWPYSYLIRIMHERFQVAFSTLYCRDILEEERAAGEDPLCMDTYELGAEVVTSVLLDAEKLLKNINDEEKLR